MSNAHTILVVEDDWDIAEALREVLSSEGYEVATAGNGREALERLQQIDAPCLILLDLMMPVMSGVEFLTVLRQTEPMAKIPVVVVSAWRNEAALVRAQTQGFVSKPVSLHALLDTAGRFCSAA